MLRSDGKHKERGLARDPAEYRSWRRNNSVKWYGVLPDNVITQPKLVRVISQRGEVNYQRKTSKV